MSSKKYPETKPDSAKPSKVAESVATYTTSPAATKRKSSAKSHRIAGFEASDEVWEFAQKHRLVPHLETAIRLAKESVDNPQTLYLTFEPDPEIPSLHGIGINGRVSSHNLDDWERQHRAFQKSFLQEIPKEVQHKICLFLWGA
jgi:hypothetical protein